MARVLILYATVGTRHVRAAEALARAFALRPPCEVSVEDALSRASRLFRQGYFELADRAPALISYAYDRATLPDWPVFAELRDLVERYSGLEPFVRRRSPDAVICTHFLPTYLLARPRRRGRLSQPLYCVVTDYAGHSFWVNEGVDGYFVPSEEVRRQLVAQGVRPETVYVAGFPVDPQLALPSNPQAARRALNLPEGPLLTLFAHRLSRHELYAAVEALLASDLAGTLAVVAGRSRLMQRHLRPLREVAQRRRGQAGLQLRVLGPVEPADGLFAASDLVVGKPGGQLIAEALARGVPMLLVEPTVGQEEWNADYVVALGAGEQLRLSASLPGALQRLMARPERLSAMRTRARAAGKPAAAIMIADIVLGQAALSRPRKSFNPAEIPSLT
jgi:processive 1,2-diacylglycerol beta-glucosyltransferase